MQNKPLEPGNEIFIENSLLISAKQIRVKKSSSVAPRG